MLYMLQLLDPIVEHGYNVIYFHTLVEGTHPLGRLGLVLEWWNLFETVHLAAQNKPPMSWIKQLYGIFNRKYKKNLQRLFIVHPSAWIK